MRHTWHKLLLSFILVIPVAAQQPPVNGGGQPTPNQISPQNQVKWPMPDCQTGVYVPSSNTCVPTGTAANPAPPTGAIQKNVGGVFGPATDATDYLSPTTGVKKAGDTMSGDLTVGDATHSASLASSLSPYFNIIAFGGQPQSFFSGACTGTAGSNVYTCSGTSLPPTAVNWPVVAKDAAFAGSPVPSPTCTNTAGAHVITGSGFTFRGAEAVWVTGFTGACSDLNAVRGLSIWSNGPASPTSTFFQINYGTASGGPDTSAGTITQTKDLAGIITAVALPSGGTQQITLGPDGCRSPDMNASFATTFSVSGGFNETPAFNAMTAAMGQYANKLNTSGHTVPTGYTPIGAYYFGLKAPGDCSTPILNPITFGQLKGDFGSGQTRWYYDGVVDHADQSWLVYLKTSGGNNYIGGLEMLPHSQWYPPYNPLYYGPDVDALTYFDDIHISGFTGHGISFGGFIINGFLIASHLRIDSYCGDAMYFGNGIGMQTNLIIYGQTDDPGSTIQTFNNCQQRSRIEVDLSNQAANNYGSHVIILGGRYENQHASNSQADINGYYPLIRFTTTGGADVSTYLPSIYMSDLEVARLSFTKMTLVGTNDATGRVCPQTIVIDRISNNNSTTSNNLALKAYFMTPTGLWCAPVTGVSGGVPIQQPPELAKGKNFVAHWQPNLMMDPQTIPRTGPEALNVVPDSEFIQLQQGIPTWTVPTTTPPWAYCASCGFQGSAGYQVMQTGAAILPLSVTAAMPKMTAGNSYFVSVNINAANTQTGQVCLVIQGTGFTTQKILATAGTSGTFSGFVTVPVGASNMTIALNAYTSIGTSGTPIIFSQPMVVQLDGTNWQQFPYVPSLGMSASGSAIRKLVDGEVRRILGERH